MSKLPYSRSMVCCTSGGLAQGQGKKRRREKYKFKKTKYIQIKI
jgi:hypothetical protein